MVYIIWHDSDYDLAFWVYKNSKLRNIPEEVLLKELPYKNTSEKLLASLEFPRDSIILPTIKYEHPDIIIQKYDESTNKILCVNEFMTQTPQWEHPAQRFSRIYGASKLKIPSALVVPKTKAKLEKEKKKKNPKYVENSYVLSPVINSLFDKTTTINQTPTLIFHWPDKNGYQKTDPEHPTAPKLVDDIKLWFDFVNLAIDDKITLTEPTMKKIIDRNKSAAGPIDIKNYGTIRGIVKTVDPACRVFGILKSQLPKKIIEREHSLVFEPSGLSPPKSYFRTDPYAGMLSAFDILFCRDDSGSRKYNLVLRAKGVEMRRLRQTGTFIDKRNHDLSMCPFTDYHTVNKLSDDDIKQHLLSKNCPYTSTKQQRVYGEISDLILFDDGDFYLSD